MKKIKLAPKHACTGCMVCVDTCCHHAITTVIDKDGHRYPLIDSTKCVSCGLCQKKCPIISNFDYSQPCLYNPLLAWSNDDNIRLNSASGGIFGGLAKKIILEGGYVCGCRMEGLSARHVIIDNISCLSQLQGSKYVHSDMTGVYSQIHRILKDTNSILLYSGTRCQVAGLLSYLGRSYDNLFTVDLVCGGVPSSHLLDFYEGRYKTIHSFRNKKKGWRHGYELTFVSNNGDLLESEPDADFQAQGYLAGLTNRYSCYDCKFATPHSKADLTLMDFWGEKEHPEEHFKGVSCVIPNSEKGIHLLNEADITIIESDWTKCASYNHRIFMGECKGAKYNLIRRILPYAFFYFSKNTLRYLYVDSKSAPLPIHIILKAYKYIMWKIMSSHIKKQKQIFVNR